MSEFITLLGAEGVAAAGREMASAADTMSNAAGQIEATLQAAHRRDQETLDRLESILQHDREMRQPGGTE